MSDYRDGSLHMTMAEWKATHKDFKGTSVDASGQRYRTALHFIEGQGTCLVPVTIVTFYVTTFCNFAHNLETGRPVGHECYILPPAALRAERDGKTDEAIRILQEQGKGPIVKGRKEKK